MSKIQPNPAPSVDAMMSLKPGGSMQFVREGTGSSTLRTIEHAKDGSTHYVLTDGSVLVVDPLEPLRGAEVRR